MISTASPNFCCPLLTCLRGKSFGPGTEFNCEGLRGENSVFIQPPGSCSSSAGLASKRRESHRQSRRLSVLENTEGVLLRGLPPSNEGQDFSQVRADGLVSGLKCHIPGHQYDTGGSMAPPTVDNGRVDEVLESVVREVEGRIAEVKRLHMKRLPDSTGLKEAARALIGLGATKNQVVRILSFRRRQGGESFVLKNSNLDALIRKRAYLLASFGVNSAQFIRMAAVYPPLLRSSEHNILEAVQMLRSIGVQNFPRVLRLLTTNLGMRPPSTFRENVAIVLSAGCTDVVNMAERDPSFLYRSPASLEAKVRSLVALVGPEEAGALLQRAPHLLTMRTATVNETYRGLLLLLGREQVREMVAKQPRILSLSWRTVQPKIAVLTGPVMRYGLEDVVRFPTALTTSLGRIEARSRVLPMLEVERRPALSSLLCSAKNFTKNYGIRLLTEEEKIEYEVDEDEDEEEGGGR